MTETQVAEHSGQVELAEPDDGFRTVQRVVLPQDAESDSIALYVELGTRVQADAAESEPAADTVAGGAAAATATGEAHKQISRRDVLGRTRVRVPQGQRLSFGTYFNAFPASYWRKWTTIDSVRLRIETSGTAHIIVYRSNARGIPQRVVAADVADTVTTTFDLPLKPFGDGGWYWFDIESGGKSVEVVGAQWQAAADLAPRNGRITLAMTTLNKNDDVLRNIATIATDQGVRDRLDEMIVVDQGSARVQRRPEFAALAESMDDQLRVIEQGNIGGSGGFARGLYEATTAERSEYVILMDDDIDIEPESIVRLLAFADYAKRPTLVGAHMFDINNRSVLHTFGERVDPWRIQPVPAHEDLRNGHNFTQRSLRSTSWLHRRADVDYNGWWMTLIPTEVVREIGLALPVFIKWDDAEYGLRARAAGYPTVSLPGAGVWHMSWIDKDDMVGWQAYFHNRNRLIVALLYSQYPGGGGAPRQAIQDDLKHLLSMQYYTAEGRVRGLKELLAGPGRLHPTIGTALPEIRGMVADFADAQYQPDADAYPAVDRGKPRNRGRGVKAPRIHTLLPWVARTAARQLVEPVKQRAAEAPQEAIPFIDARWWRLSQYDSALVTNAEGTGVAWYRRDPAELRRRLAETVRLHLDLQARWPQLRRDYQRALPEITSFEAWRQTFEQNPARHDD